MKQIVGGTFDVKKKLQVLTAKDPLEIVEVE